MKCVDSMGIRFVLVLILSLVLSGCTDKLSAPPAKDRPGITLLSEYHAVFLDNGQAFFGKLENADADYPVLKDVFYIQRLVNKDTNEVKNTLIKRGSEWHGPDMMYVNSRHIVLIEPVNPNSRVSLLIAEAKKGGGEAKPAETGEQVK